MNLEIGCRQRSDFKGAVVPENDKIGYIKDYDS